MTAAPETKDGRPEPLITFVGYTRNDGYARLFEKRLTLLAGQLKRQAEEHALAVELLLVEWNPPAGKPGIASLLSGVISSRYFTLRIITVPAKYHQGFAGADEKGLHPARALNVGYRRAAGQFVSPIASDAVLSDAVFAVVKQTGLEADKVYRLDRIDVDDGVLETLDPEAIAPDALEATLMGAAIHRHAPLDDDMVFHYGVKPLHTNGCGDFLMMARDAWHALRGQKEDCGVDCLDTDSIALHAAVASGLNEVRLPDSCVVYKMAHTKMFRLKTGPYRPPLRHMIEKLINALVPHRPTRALVRALADVPRRQINGLSGSFPSMERNLIWPARAWARRGKQVRLADEGWGLGGVDLPEQTL